MKTVISTDRQAQAAKPGEDGGRVDYSVARQPGLQLRVTSTRKLWSLQYVRRSDGKRRRVQLGEYPATGLAEVCIRAGKLRNEIQAGADPARDRETERDAATFEALALNWLERHAKVKKRSWRQDERMIRHDLLPSIGGMRAGQVTRVDIVHLIDAIADRGSPYSANRVLTLANTIFRWGMKRGEIEVNPAAMIGKPGNEQRRKRALTEDEIKGFWLGLEAAKLSAQMRIILRLTLLLGVRINELALARKAEFDLDGGRWLIPGTREMPGGRKDSGAKNKREHPLPLGAEAIRLLHEAFRLSGDPEWLFPSSTNKGQPVGETAVSRAWGRVRDAMALGDVQARDLRRSFATVAGWCGFDDFNAGLVLNHTTARGTVTSIYNRAEYIPEKTRVIEAVERRILEIAGGLDRGCNVVQLKAAR